MKRRTRDRSAMSPWNRRRWPCCNGPRSEGDWRCVWCATPRGLRRRLRRLRRLLRSLIARGDRMVDDPKTEGHWPLLFRRWDRAVEVKVHLQERQIAPYLMDGKPRHVVVAASPKRSWLCHYECRGACHGTLLVEFTTDERAMMGRKIPCPRCHAPGARFKRRAWSKEWKRDRWTPGGEFLEVVR